MEKEGEKEKVLFEYFVYLGDTLYRKEEK